MWDVQNQWDAPQPHCYAVANNKCTGIQHPDPYSYVPTSGSMADPGIGLYAQLIQRWEIATNVLQANEGPSFIAHQYVIAAQSGGIMLALSSPDAEAENPSKNVPSTSTPFPTGPTTETNSDIDMMSTSGCDHGSQYAVKTIKMSISGTDTAGANADGNFSASITGRHGVRPRARSTEVGRLGPTRSSTRSATPTTGARRRITGNTLRTMRSRFGRHRWGSITSTRIGLALASRAAQRPALTSRSFATKTPGSSFKIARAAYRCARSPI